MSDCDLCKPIKEKGKNCLCDMHLNWVLKENRKQGAVEELKKVLELIDEDFENDSWVKTSNYCIERIKELEKEGV